MPILQEQKIGDAHEFSAGSITVNGAECSMVEKLEMDKFTAV